MDLTLIKLSLEKLHENMEAMKLMNKTLLARVNTLEKREGVNFASPGIVSTPLEEELLDTKQVRKILGVSHNTLQAIVRAGKLVQKRINGRSVRYSRSDVKEYIESLN